MIQYDISAEQYRIGWIEASSLPKGKNVGWMSFGNGVQTLSRDCMLTDDPLNSGKPLCELTEGMQVVNLCNLGYDWVYVQTTLNGKPCCGFVPSDALKQ